MFFNTLSLREALELALARVRPLAQRETLDVAAGLHRVLAAAVLAPQDLPGFDRSSMDGYAVRAADTYAASEAEPAVLQLEGRVEMGRDAAALPPLAAGRAYAISTGGMLPPGADAVVILEETERSGDALSVLSPVAPGACVIAADSDYRHGQRVFEPGHRLRAPDLGALLALGITRVEAFGQLQVAVLSTGDELVPPETRPAPGQVRDINTTTVAAQLRGFGLQPVSFGIVPDGRRRLADAAAHALAECDAVLISGGSSVGARDATVDVLAQLGEVLVHGIRIAPGKPTILALCGDKPVFGLPGNPVSSMVVVDKFVAPVLRRRSGASEVWSHPPQVRAVLSQSVSSARGRDDFVRVRLVEADGRRWAEPIFAHSNNISSLSGADGLLPIPAEAEGVARGTEVVVELW